MFDIIRIINNQIKTTVNMQMTLCSNCICLNLCSDSQVELKTSKHGHVLKNSQQSCSSYYSLLCQVLWFSPEYHQA